MGIVTAGMLVVALVATIVSSPLGNSPTSTVSPPPANADAPAIADPSPIDGPPRSDSPATVASPLGAGPLRTNGGNIVDADGRVVHITGVNWFGLETSTFAPQGLWARSLNDMLDQMVQAGFNTIRLPYSNQLFDARSTPNGIDFQKNPVLQWLNGQ